MKDQYIGDVNDYIKYALLRALAGAHNGRLHVCWMLTPADGRTDGGRVTYLTDALRFRDFDPRLFDALANLVSADRRSVRAIEATKILPSAIFHTDILPDAAAGRQLYFAKVWSRLDPGDLIFFDPDNGLEVSSVQRGGRNSSKYLYWDELAIALNENRSICAYQHFPRRPRAAFVASLLDQIGDLAPNHDAFAVSSPWVAYIVCAPPDRAHHLYEAAAEVAARPGSRLVLGQRSWSHRVGGASD
jgi:hypothetical protein